MRIMFICASLSSIITITLLLAILLSYQKVHLHSKQPIVILSCKEKESKTISSVWHHGVSENSKESS